MDYDNEIRYFLLKNRSFNLEMKKDNAIKVEEWKMLNSRIDIAIINGFFVGYEIKSKKDTLEKLPKQVDDYLKIFDKLSLIIDKKHLKKIEDMVPSFVGIILAEKNLPIYRKSIINIQTDKLATASLLWKNELLDILLKKGITKIKSKGKEELTEVFADSFKDDTAFQVREAIKNRYNKTEWQKPKPSIWDQYLTTTPDFSQKQFV